MRAQTPSAPEVRAELARAGGGIIAVHDNTGTLARATFDELNDPEDGLVMVQVRSGTRRLVTFAADLQTALGVDQELTGFGRPGEGSWELATVTVLAENIGHVVVLDPWLLTPTLLGELIERLQATGAVLWLVGRATFSDAHRQVVDRWTTTLIDADAFRAAWADRPKGPRPASRTSSQGTDDFPVHVADVDFPMFRAACRDHLTAEEFTAVDTHFITCAATAREWFLTHLGPETLANEEALAARLHEQWHQSPTTAHFIVAIRAFQVAAFSIDWQLQVDLPQLVGTARVSPHVAARSPQVWARLRGYASPHRGAVCALTAAGIDLADQPALTVESITGRGRHVITPDGRRVAVEDGAAPYLYAQKLARLIQGAPGDAPLLINDTGAALRERALADILTTARIELGLNLVGLRAERRQPTGDRWLTRWGLSIQELRR